MRLDARTISAYSACIVGRELPMAELAPEFASPEMQAALKALLRIADAWSLTRLEARLEGWLY